MSELIALAWPIVALVGIGCGLWMFMAWRLSVANEDMNKARIDGVATGTKTRFGEMDAQLAALAKATADHGSATQEASHRIDKLEKALAILPPLASKPNSDRLKEFR